MVACRKKDEEKLLHKHNLIILPQLYQTEVLFRSHDQLGHQGIGKVLQRTLHRFDWPGLRKACESLSGMSTGERSKEDGVPAQVR